MLYRLTVTQFAAGNDNIAESCTIMQDDVFEHNSDLKHGLQRKAIESVLRESLRAEFSIPKWTNEDIRLGELIQNSELYMVETGKDADDYPVGRMMHMTAFNMADESCRHLALYRVNDTATVTVEGTARNINADKDWFIVEINDMQAGELNASREDTLQAANLRAAKLRVNGTAEEYDGKWGDMPFNGGIYKDSTSQSSILVLRPATAEEAAELDEAASE